MQKPQKKSAKKKTERAPRAPKITPDTLREMAAKSRKMAGSLEFLADGMESANVSYLKYDGSSAGAQGLRLLAKFVAKSGTNLQIEAEDL